MGFRGSTDTMIYKARSVKTPQKMIHTVALAKAGVIGGLSLLLRNGSAKSETQRCVAASHPSQG